MISDLPENIRKTALILLKLGEATAEDIARITGRKRSTESYYLNLMADMNLVKKKKVGRKIYFIFNGKD
ncbi:helix-turn-helix domain-containing protein [Archaeoglobus neptunius]|uniref:helix-turn-helix domain-containing protein n=1 Tax=Archaeoglobus neptunius TaxID=2798580 RepID=UPI0019297D52|nr:helix-turn-helix domain-containing protein [Archaeoglobus neptunius]